MPPYRVSSSVVRASGGQSFIPTVGSGGHVVLDGVYVNLHLPSLRQTDSIKFLIRNPRSSKSLRLACASKFKYLLARISVDDSSVNSIFRRTDSGEGKELRLPMPKSGLHVITRNGWWQTAGS
jgi:hypothetical protein